MLPGVGAFKKAMNELKERNLVDALIESSNNNAFILGICLGMQLLFDKSFEFGENKGLGLISGDVIPIPNKSQKSNLITIPHIGWNALNSETSSNDWEKTILDKISLKSEVYFIHSFMVNPKNSNRMIASCDYEGIKIPSVVTKNNIFGCQFHPEKSGSIGSRIIKNFINFDVY